MHETASLFIHPIRHRLDAVVRVPGSKSLTNRALLMAGLADGCSRLTGILLADDTRHMLDCLAGLGIVVRVDERTRMATVSGCAGQIPATEASFYCGNSGTTLRFCTAMSALGYGRYHFDGVERMHERPLGALADALRRLGARIEHHQREGYPPHTVHASGLAGGTVNLAQAASSQMISAILMACPYARDDVFVELAGPVISAPYVEMTVKLMHRFGVEVVSRWTSAGARFIVPSSQRYSAVTYDVEPDASNASYFLAAPALVGGSVTVPGLGSNSLQGDLRFVELLSQMGCSIDCRTDSVTVTGPPEGTRLKGIDVDLNAMPDMAQTLAVLAVFADGPTTIRNVGNLRIKETDRISALAAELTKLGADVSTTDDSLSIHPPVQVKPARINTYDDHRMAMSFALAGLVADGIHIQDPTCVSKTFPDFFECWGGLADVS